MTMPETDRIRSVLQQNSVFASCSPASIDQFISQSSIISVDKGQILCLHEEPAKRFFIVLSGWVKLFRETLEGTQAVVDILPADHMFGETSIFQGLTYPYSAEAVEPCDLLSLPLSLLQAEIEENAKVALSMLSAMARFRRQQDRELEHQIIQNAPQRIGCFLLRLANQEKSGPLTIHLPYDKTLVASRLGMQPETFSRALGKLKDATGIEIKGSTIQLKSLDQLVNFSCAACSSEFPCKDLCNTHSKS